MSQIEQEIRNAVFGRDDYPPKVHFYDHPVPDEEATERSDRPRYKEVVYVVIKPTHPDLAVKDFRSRAMVETDQRMYPQQWQKYLESKERIDARNPSIEAIPGMTVAAHAELKALGLFDCDQLAAHEGDLAPYNHLKLFAKKVMELSNEFKDLPEEREPVRVEEDRRQQQQGISDWPSTYYSNPQTINQKESVQKGSQEKGHQENQEVTFNFEVTV